MIALLCPLGLPAQTPKPNIVFFFLDDLNDFVEGYEGHPQVETPNIAALSEHGAVFLNTFANSTKCMPSRISMFSGKEVAYTQVEKNVMCEPFRDFFNEAHGNPDVFTFAEVLKDSAGYFTYGINKINHCFATHPDYDATAPDDCSRGLSWNKYFYLDGGEGAEVTLWVAENVGLTPGLNWAKVADSMETKMLDYKLVDSALDFIDNYDADPSVACNKPVFMMMGFRKPHLPWYIPEHYFSDFYLDDVYEIPFPYPYNNPETAFPYNGIKLTPQPDPIWSDYFALPADGLAQIMAEEEHVQPAVDSAYLFQLPLPAIDTGLSPEERKSVMAFSYQANATMAYLASAKFIDAQIGRMLDSMKINYPDFYNNTVFIFSSDHGYTLGEKRSWQKGTLWETDIRVPLVIFDARSPLPTKRVVSNVTSLLDIFPTLLDYAGSPYPMIDGETPYLDGESLLPYIANPNLTSERAVVTGLRSKTVDCNCFPQWSVRTDQFHYIYYTSNNENIATPGCQEGEGFHEEELYEIGRFREHDPNEWDNLIDDPDYDPVLQYMRSLLPDSLNYQKDLYKALMQVKSPGCLPSRMETVKIIPQLLNSNGVPVTGPALSNLTFTWTNNLTGHTFSSKNLNFPLSLVPETIFEASEEILFYLHVTDNTSGQLVAFNLAHVYINPDLTPVVDYSLSTNGSEIFIDDLVIEGQRNSTSWRIVGQYQGAEMPSPFTASSSGTYNYKLSVSYGNKPSCVVQANRVITLLETPERISAELPLLQVYPNPAGNSCLIYLADENYSGLIRVYSGLGTPVYEAQITADTPLRMQTAQLPAGVYTIRLEGRADVLPVRLVVAH